MASSSSSPSPPPWRLSPRPTTARPSRPTIRRRSQPRIHLIKLSLSDPSRSAPPLKVPKKGDSDPSLAVLSSRAVSSGSSADVVVVVGGEDEARTDGNRRVRLVSLTKKKRRPLWRRIFFASKKVRGIILLNVLTVIYATNIPVVKEVEEIMDPALFTVVRFVMSAIPFLPFIWKARGDDQTRAAGIELGIWVSLGYLAQALGLLTSDAGRASFISAFTVIAVPLIDGLFGAKVPALTWFGAFASLIGVAMLESSGSPPTVGDLLNIMGAVFFGIHMLRTEHISRTTKKEKFLALLGYEVCVVALLSMVWYILRGTFSDCEQASEAPWAWVTAWDWVVSFPWIPALYTGIFSTGLCLWAEMTAMRDVLATEAAIIYGLEPLWGAAFAWFLLGERWGTIGWIGATLVLGGSLTVQILGSSTGEVEKSEKDIGGYPMQVPDEQNNISLSTVVINSRKNVTNLIKKRNR
ncbi:hypothetical protein QJS04_geneDACA011911 [Acorus gramineus]|uniref:EamA domain-containing protein n=1 Tax=Acorus gramineus TaxID=55184 RepID=A0AAV9AFE0_ACOGR|nr:hypothetical protein QJS04_geneDACA011911 [Acorus gramineus]